MHSRILIIVLLSLVLINSSFSQTKIKIEKNRCCEKLSVMIGIIRHGDTISYDKLMKIRVLGVMFINCNYNSKASIESYEIQIKDTKQFIKGNVLNYYTLRSFEKGGEFIIKNCKVICTNDDNKSKIIILPDRKIVVIGTN